MAKKYILTPLLILYAGGLIFTATDRGVIPGFLGDAHLSAKLAMHTAGITPGMRVFPGPRERLEVLLIARCTLADGIDAAGNKTRIYPTEPCPEEGFTWHPVIYDHLIVHWMSWIQFGDHRAIVDALGHHFCGQAENPETTHVDLTSSLALRHYDTGESWTQNEPLGRVECRR